MRIAWFILAVVLFLIGFGLLLNSIYWLVIGYYYGPVFMVGSFIPPLIFCWLGYEAWKRAKKSL